MMPADPMGLGLTQNPDQLGVLSGMSLPFNLPFGMPPMMASSGAMAQWNQSANFTQILATFSNMTTSEAISSLQTILLTALMRQYMFNDFFAGGLGLMLVGFLGTKLRGIWAALVRKLYVEKGEVRIRVEHGSEVFHWIQDWLKQHAKVSSTNYDVHCEWKAQDYDDANYGETEQRPTVGLTPEFKNAQEILYKGEKVWVQSSSQLKGGGGGGGGEDLLALLKASSSAKDDLVLSSSSKKILEDLVQEAMDEHYKQEEQKSNPETRVYRWSCDEMYWVDVGSRKARPLDSVVLDCNPESLIADAKKFLSSSAWYADRGIPHRRGYLLYGPPGCGKTSLIKAVAGELRLDVSLISLASKELNDDVLQRAMGSLPHRSIFVLEDVDAAFSQGKAGQSHSEDEAPDLGPFAGVSARVSAGQHSLTFSGLLNALDGITAQEGNIVVMTTNHLEKLDAALVRPGRVDLRLMLGLASTKQACGVFRRFYPEASQEQEAQVAAAVPDALLSPASLQGLFLEHRDDLAGILAKLPAFVADAQAASAKKKSAGETPAGEGRPSCDEKEMIADGRKKSEWGEGKRKKDKKRKKNRERKAQIEAAFQPPMRDVSVVSDGKAQEEPWAAECGNTAEDALKAAAGVEDTAASLADKEGVADSSAHESDSEGDASECSEASGKWETVVKQSARGRKLGTRETLVKQSASGRKPGAAGIESMLLYK